MSMTRRAVLGTLPLFAQTRNYPPELKGFEKEIYRRVGGVELGIWILGRSQGAPRAAAVFFFGGGWTGGSPGQFEHQARLLAAKGMTVLLADYRVKSRHNVQIDSCIADAKAAMRWTRANAKRLHIDPKRIAAGGGSAGGHLAAATAVVPGFVDGDHLKTDGKPNVLLLFNPALVLPDSMKDRFGLDPAKVSPIEHVTKSAPPTIIFHGKADTTVPFDTILAYQKKAVTVGAPCIVEGYEGQGHGFFNHGRGENVYYNKTSARMVEFLKERGYVVE